jgi:hypothetical protein
VLVPSSVFLSHLMLVGKARILPKSGTHENCFTRVGSGLSDNLKITAVKSFITFGPDAGVELSDK